MTVAVVFPGQGSQRIGMGVDLAASHPSARKCFEEASEALGYDMLALCGEGPEERLRLTEYTQPAILTVSVAAYRVWHEHAGIEPAAGAGHSLGEYSALVAAGSLGFADAVRLVRLRGRAMQEAVPVGRGKMAAVLNLDSEKLDEVCVVAAEGDVVSAANLNAPGQIVISGGADAVDRAAKAALAAGARRVLPLDVSAPFHCALMQPAAERLEQALADVPLAPPRFPVYSNVTAAPHAPEPAGIREALVRQVCAPVRWEETVTALAAAGITRTVECGPGKVLSALIKRVAGDISLSNIETVADLDAWAVGR